MEWVFYRTHRLALRICIRHVVLRFTSTMLPVSLTQHAMTLLSHRIRFFRVMPRLPFNPSC